jgi:hypothetical protein
MYVPTGNFLADTVPAASRAIRSKRVVLVNNLKITSGSFSSISITGGIYVPWHNLSTDKLAIIE